MLCTAVRSENILANVENNCELVRHLVSYEQYIRLLESACTKLDTIHDSLPLCHNRSPNANREHDISFRHHLAAYSHDLAYFPSHVPPDITCQNINATEREVVFDSTSSKDVPTLQAQTVEVSMARHVEIVPVHQTRYDETLNIDHEIHDLLIDNPTSQRPIDVRLHRTAGKFDSVPTRQTTILKPAQSWVEVARMPRLDQRRFPMSRLCFSTVLSAV